MTRPVAIIVLTSSALPTALAVRRALPQAEIHAPEGRVVAAAVDIPFTDAAGRIAALFSENATIIGLCAAGILIRALAPLLRDKRAEPPVLAIAEDGGSIVPLLGGHHGANALALQLSQALGGRAALTTAGDLRLGFSLDDPPPGWKTADPAAVKPVTAALLAGEKVWLQIQAGDGAWPPPAMFAAALPTPGPGGEEDGWTVRVTDRADPPVARRLLLHPPTLALGMGCARGADGDAALRFLQQALATHGLAPQSVAALGSLDIKGDEPALKKVAATLEVPFRLFDAATLQRERPRLKHPSGAVFAQVGCHGVAEGAALALGGPAAELVVEKCKSGAFTLAIARAPRIDPADKGRAPGELFIVGLGPGRRDWRTAETRAALLRAELAVGYGLYLDMAADLLAGTPTRRFQLGEEEERARFALDRAAEGRRVALLCSGDPGVYALAAPVFELLLRHDRRDWNGVEITVMPGISAFQAAAALTGAPLGHDFALLSLSDLLTPRAEILSRAQAAAEAGFALALYNPQSRRRRQLLPELRRILLAHRPAQTPVVVARNLGRDGQQVTVCSLQAFDPEQVDMLSLVLIGARRSFHARRGGRDIVVTPRGYNLGEDGGRR